MPAKFRYSTTYEVHGPFKVPTIPYRGWMQVDVSRLKGFFAATGIAKKAGCYLFGLSRGEVYTPWYIGKTKRNFSVEAFERKHKIPHYNAVLRLKRRSPPVMFFLTRLEARGRPSSDPHGPLERYLIQECVTINPELRNDHSTTTDLFVIRGVIDIWVRGRRTTAASAFRCLLNV